MGIFNRIFTKHQVREDAELLAEEKLYEYVGKEIESNNIRSGLWTKATSTAASRDPEDITAEYIRLRVEYLLAEGRLYQQFLQEVYEIPEEEEEDEDEEEEGGLSKGSGCLLYTFICIMILFIFWLIGAFNLPAMK